jgi:hypothetical protein
LLIIDVINIHTISLSKDNDAANKVSRRPGAHPAGKRIVNNILTLPVITTCKVVITSESVSMK